MNLTTQPQNGPRRLPARFGKCLEDRTASKSEAISFAQSYQISGSCCLEFGADDLCNDKDP